MQSKTQCKVLWQQDQRCRSHIVIGMQLITAMPRRRPMG
jgi:hypothetical protein